MDIKIGIAIIESRKIRYFEKDFGLLLDEITKNLKNLKNSNGPQKFKNINFIYFTDKDYFNKIKVEEWPKVDVFLPFNYKNFPVDLVRKYVEINGLGNKIINDLDTQLQFTDRDEIYKILREIGVNTPKSIKVDFDNLKHLKDLTISPDQSYIQQNNIKLSKPFIEKPLSSDQHEITIYHNDIEQSSTKVNKTFQVAKNHNNHSINLEKILKNSKIKSSGKWIYEEYFDPGKSIEIKIYVAGAGKNCIYGETRDIHKKGGLQVDERGLEIREKVELNEQEIEMAMKMQARFNYFVFGFDVLRVEGRGSFVIDVNLKYVLPRCDRMRYIEEAGAILAGEINKKF